MHNDRVAQQSFNKTREKMQRSRKLRRRKKLAFSRGQEVKKEEDSPLISLLIGVLLIEKVITYFAKVSRIFRGLTIFLGKCKNGAHKINDFLHITVTRDK